MKPIAVKTSVERYDNPLTLVLGDRSVQIFDLFDDIVYKLVLRDVSEKEYNSFNRDQYIKANRYAREKYSKIENVPFVKIIGTEPTLDRVHVDRLKQDGNRNGKSTALKHNDKYYLMDGNHRVAAEYEKRSPHAQLRVITSQ